MEMDDPAFRSETVNKLLHNFFGDKVKTKCSGDALKLMAELLKIFIAEGAARAAQQAKVESSPSVETEHLEKILPQLLLDF
ncbi:centromere protein X-like [Montipora foliosa]|uniref:centromere protein X-like n=1 Tax=Montipora foliosa TaxID=591990 RepID=UPI0035F20C47